MELDISGWTMQGNVGETGVKEGEKGMCDPSRMKGVYVGRRKEYPTVWREWRRTSYQGELSVFEGGTEVTPERVYHGRGTPEETDGTDIVVEVEGDMEMGHNT